MVLDEIERLRVTVRDLWHERQAAGPATDAGLALRDSEIADQSKVDLDTVRAFLVSEDGRGIIVKADDGALSVSNVDLGYGE
jgi:hypothetical protein